MSFKENLREALDFSGLEQKELADQSGISLRSIENYLKNASPSSIPSADKAVRMARVLKVSVEYLITGMDADWAKSLPFMRSGVRQLLKSIKQLSESDQKLVLDNALNLSEILYRRQYQTNKAEISSTCQIGKASMPPNTNF